MLPMPDHKWWQDWKFAGAIGVVFLGVGLIMFALSTNRTADSVEAQQPVIERLDSLAQNNNIHLEALRRNQAGIDALVAYVEEAKAKEAAGQDAVTFLVDLLCSSEDPVRQAACAEIQGDSP